MSIEAVKLEVMQQLLFTDSEELLEQVRELLRDSKSRFELTDAQKAGLDAQRLRHERSEGKSHTWEQVKADAQRAIANRKA